MERSIATASQQALRKTGRSHFHKGIASIAQARKTGIRSPDPREMDLHKIIGELIDERNRIDRIIKVLEEASSTFDGDRVRFAKPRRGRKLPNRRELHAEPVIPDNDLRVLG
jgi:hypothetical protein